MPIMQNECWVHYATAKGTVDCGTLWFVDSYSVVSSNVSPLGEDQSSNMQLCFLLTLANISNISLSCNGDLSKTCLLWRKRTIKTAKGTTGGAFLKFPG